MNSQRLYTDFEYNRNTTICLMPQEFNTTSEFFSCLDLIIKSQLQVFILLVLLWVFTVLLNVLVIIILCRRRSSLTIFDKLIVCHCICDGLTGLLDEPFYDLIQMFDYWPLSTFWGLVWSIFDNGLSTVNNTSMLYLTYVRMRSIQAPNTFGKEILIRKPFIVVAVYWILGFLLWIPVILGFGLTGYSNQIDFQPYYVGVIIDFLFLFLPLALTICLSFQIVWLLKKHKQTRDRLTRSVALNKLRAKTNNNATLPTRDSTSSSISSLNYGRRLVAFVRSTARLGSQTKFLIIIISYWIQWLPSYLIDLLNPICRCVPFNVSQDIYWMTFTVCLTDPIVVLLFNPNVAISSLRTSRRVQPR